ncbi:carbonic anhydrase precursor [archaeon BMS3Abin16]|nr:carbonic anhydrase precursor [archaeon BMS3Abin16]
MLNNGHTLQVSLEPGSTLTVDGEEYDLLQFHFHTVSENTIAGKHYPMEIHFVHKSSAGGLAVISVMVEEGSSNTAIKPIVNLLPTAAGEENVLDEAFNPETLLPSDKSVYRFMGSLTTPPCSEGVKWHVAKELIGMSKDQIASFAHIMGDNFRPTQREIGAAEGQSGGSTGIAAIVVILLVAAGLVVYLKKK